MKCAEKTASIVAAFALAAAAFVTPVQAEEQGFWGKTFDKVKSDMQQNLDNRKQAGGMEGAITRGTQSAINAVGDKTSEITGVPTAARQIPKYQGLSFSREQLVCYNQIDGKPDPKEHPQYYRDFVQARVAGPRDTTPFRTNERAFDTPGRGGKTDATAFAAELTNTMLSNCAEEVAAGRMHPIGAPNYTSGKPDQLVRLSHFQICHGEPAEDWKETKDTLVSPRGINEAIKYGPGPIMRCNEELDIYKPVKLGDNPLDPEGKFIPISAKLAAAETIKIRAQLDQMRADYEKNKSAPTAPRKGGYGNAYAP